MPSYHSRSTGVVAQRAVSRLLGVVGVPDGLVG